MPEPEMTMRHYWLFLRSAVLLGAIGTALPACETVLKPFVGQSKEAAARDKAAAIPPPSPPPTASFVNDSRLSPGYVGSQLLPPTMTIPDDAVDASDDIPAASSGPHRAIAAIPLTSDMKALGALSAAANREPDIADARFVLLVLSPPASDAPTLDRTNNTARLAAVTAVKVLGDGGIAADHVEIAMATSPTAAGGELRLYRR
jgi:hypothetical protein